MEAQKNEKHSHKYFMLPLIAGTGFYLGFFVLGGIHSKIIFGATQRGEKIF